MTALGQQISIKTPAQLSALIAEDSARWGQVVRDNNIHSD
jgi:tripartite-type tricarboxylate transporter receptor subunit TctC